MSKLVNRTGIRKCRIEDGFYVVATQHPVRLIGYPPKGGDFIRGHDAKVMSAIMDKVGGTIKLRDLVEKTLNCRIKPRWD